MPKIIFLIALGITLQSPVNAQQEDVFTTVTSQVDANYLADYKSRERVVALDSGLLYRVIRRGSGTRPLPDDTVVAHFRGKLVDDTVFDTTYVRSSAEVIKLDDTLPGLSEGLALMREGAEYEFVLPPELAYGAQSPDDLIGPNSVLVYDVELLHVVAPVRTAPSAAQRNFEEGRRFLEENRNKAGVVTLDSGLQYKILRPGTGPQPRRSGRVTVHYSGRFINGTEFDSSYARGERTEFRITRVIPGWTEALRLMQEGAHWEIYVPSELAYGTEGLPPTVGPNTTLIFRIELFDAR